MHTHTTEDTLIERRDDFIAILQGGADKTAQSTAVLLGNDDVVRDVDKTTSEVTGVSCLQSGISKTLAGTVRRDKVLKHAHTFLEVRQNRVLNNLCLSTGLLGLGHKTTHT